MVLNHLEYYKRISGTLRVTIDAHPEDWGLRNASWTEPQWQKKAVDDLKRLDEELDIVEKYLDSIHKMVSTSGAL
jgi:hypothetical protein